MGIEYSDIVHDRITLSSGTTADGQTTVKTWPGGDGSFVSWGTWGSGTNKLQFAAEAGTTIATTSFTWIDVPGVSLTANGIVNFRVGPTSIRSSLSGSTSPSIQTVIL